MDASALNQRQLKAYARFEPAAAFMAKVGALPEDPRPLSTVSHSDASIRALFKLESIVATMVRIAEAQGYEEQAPEEFKPNGFWLGDQTPMLQPMDEDTPAVNENAGKTFRSGLVSGRKGRS